MNFVAFTPNTSNLLQIVVYSLQLDLSTNSKIFCYFVTPYLIIIKQEFAIINKFNELESLQKLNYPEFLACFTSFFFQNRIH